MGDYVIVDPWLGDLLVIFLVAAVLLALWVLYTGIEEPWRFYGRKFVALHNEHGAILK
jgi:hypothetical protein